jgi:hypothetical protein
MVGAVLVGSVAVAAACSSTNGSGPNAGSDGGLFDSLTDTVADTLGLDHVENEAAAAEKPTVDEVSCDKKIGANYFAEKTYPGRAKADLARGVALVCKSAADPDGYACVQFAADVKDGAVRVLCGSDSTPKVLITMPPAL